MLNSLKGASLSRLPFEGMSPLEVEFFSDLQEPSRLALVEIRNRILKMWFENTKKKLTEYAVQKMEASYNSNPVLVLRTHTFLERHGFINYGMYERITPILNPPSADSQKIKQDVEETHRHNEELSLDPNGAYSLYEDHQVKTEIVISSTVFRPMDEYLNEQEIKQDPELTLHHVDELPLDPDGAHSLYEDHQIKEEMIIGPTGILTSVKIDEHKSKLAPEETQHHVDELPLNPDGAYSLYEDHQIKEEMVIGPTELRPVNECSSVAVSKKKRPRNKQETKKQTAEKNLPTTVKEENENNSSNRVSVTVICDKVLKYSCDICEYSVNQAKDLNAHLKAHAAAEKFRCDVCSYITTQKYLLISHFKSHSNDRPFVCKTCDSKFKNPWNLKKHLRVHTGEKSYFCEDCHKNFCDGSTLQKHRRIHTGMKPYSCDVCSKSFNQKGSLDLHRRIHTGEKLFSCDICHKSFSHPSTLRIHRRMHTGEKPFSCEVCHKNFNRMYHLNVHRRSHTGEKPYSCVVCHKSYRDSTTYKNHRLKHTGDTKNM